jgi:hypothetical protein
MKEIFSCFAVCTSVALYFASATLDPVFTRDIMRDFHPFFHILPQICILDSVGQHLDKFCFELKAIRKLYIVF